MHTCNAHLVIKLINLLSLDHISRIDYSCNLENEKKLIIIHHHIT
jgi:hypothetical protein